MATANDENSTAVSGVDEQQTELSSAKREAFGNRHLTNEQNVFDFNAWYI